MDDAALFERMRASMEAWFRFVGEQGPGASILERDGVLASVCPSIPGRSVFNSVLYRDPAALAASIPELDRAYEAAGVRAWTVWVPERDTEAREALERAGHALDAWPEAMVAPLGEFDLDAGAEGLEWERSRDAEAMCSILEETFSWPADPIRAVFAALPERGHVYVARVGGEPAATVTGLDHGGDCSIWNVGTRAPARGRGLASGLLRQALLDARERGLATTSLQATQAGRPVYRRLGYRELGRLEMWERRRA